MKITRISRYAWFKIDVNGIIIHIDPGYAGYYDSQHFDEELFKEKADIILITHHHKDHIQPVAIEKISGSHTKIFATKLCASLLLKPYEVTAPGFERQLDDVRIQAVFAYNTLEGHSTRKPHHKGECVGYIIEAGSVRIYHAGDTDLIPEMSNLGNIDIALLPIGGTFTMDIEEACQATVIIKPKYIIPMHALKADPKLFSKQLTKMPDTVCVNLEPSQTYQINY